MKKFLLAASILFCFVFNIAFAFTGPKPSARYREITANYNKNANKPLNTNKDQPVNPTVLTPGDIAVIGFDITDLKFTFVTLVQINAGTVINFTDKGWTGSGFVTLTSEGTLTWTTNATVNAGTVVTVSFSAASSPVISGFPNGTTSYTGWTVSVFANNGDQMIVFQGTEASPTFIYGFNCSVLAGSPGATTDWQTGSVTSNRDSQLPTGLTNSTNSNAATAIAFTGQGTGVYHNYAYNGKVYGYTGTKTQLLTLIGNRSYWQQSATALDLSLNGTYFPTTFNLGGGTPTITASGTLTAVGTTYGTATATPTSFTAGGSNLTNDITVTLPAGFEASTSATGTYSSPLTLTQSGGSYSGTVYVRLAANATAGAHSGNITLSSTGATDAIIATASSTVTQAVLTYTADAASRVVGATDPTYTGNVTGLVNNESLSAATTGTAVWTTTATSASTAGTYPINGSGLSSTNYSFVQAAGNATALTITQPVPPTITNFSPASGQAGSTTVTITGTNFSATAANNIVFFGTVKATVSLASTTSLTVTAPSGATYAPITVVDLDSHLMATSAKQFLPTFTPNKGAIVSPDDFETKVDLAATSTSLSRVAIGDLDGDGKPDLVISNFSNGSISIFRNISTPGSITTSSFDTKIDISVGGSPRGIAIGDLDGDGKLDIAVANSSSTSVSVLRNTSVSGSISFATKVDLTTGSAPYSVAIGDLDGDGKPELAVANNSSANSVSIFRNLSTAGSITTSSFATKVDFAAGTGPINLEIADLDGDGKPDLAVANTGSASVSVLRNTATAGSITASSFATKVAFTTVATPLGLAIGDLDGDGKPDIVVAASNTTVLSVLRNTATSGAIDATSFATKLDLTQTNSGHAVAIGDLDGDGKPDLAAGNYNAPSNATSVSVFRNIAASGSLTAASFAGKQDFSVATANPYHMAIGDIDGDGRPDIVTVSATSTAVTILRNSPKGIITTGALTAFTAQSGSASASQSITVSGIFLTGDIVITAPTGFEVGTNNSTFSSSVTLTQSSGSVSATTIYVRLAATATGTPSGNIALTTTNRSTRNLAVTGTVTAPVPTIGTTGTLAAVNTTYGTASATPTSFTVAGSNLTADISVTAPTGFEMSTTLGGTYTSTLSLTQASGAYSGTVYVRLTANAVTGAHSGDITLSSTGATNATVATVSSTVTAAVLTYTATAASRAVGATDPTFSGTVTGFVNGENQAGATTGTLAWATTATSASTAGGYPINGSGLSATNYTFTQAAGNATALTITAPSTPTISTTGTLAAVNTTYGSPSATPTTFTLTGTNLTSGLIITAPAGYQISVSAASGYNNTLTLFPCGGMPLTSTIYVRLAAATGAGDYSGDITLKSTGATDATIATVSSTVSKATLTYTANAASRATGASDPTFGGTVTGFVNSENQAGATTGTLAWATTATSASTAGSYPINGSGLSAANYTFVQAAGNATALTITNGPNISTTGTLIAVNTIYGTASATPTTFVVTGTNLTSGLIITAPAGYQISTNASSGYNTTLTLFPCGGAPLTSTIYVRLAAATVVGDYSGDITLKSTGATDATIATISSSVTKAHLTYTADAASRQAGASDPTFTGTVSGFKNGQNLASATTGTAVWATTATSASIPGTYPINGSGLSATNYDLVQAGTNATALTITTPPNPFISTAGTLTAVGTTYGTASATPTSFTVGATNLTADISVSAPAGYEMSTTSGGTYTSPLTLTQSGGSYSGTVYVHLAANATAGSHSGDITLSSTGATNATVATVSSDVSKATLTYTASTASKTYGDANPTFSGTVTGFVNGENLAGATTGTASWSSAATTGSNAGSYAISGSGLSATNYTFVQAAGNATALTISKATLTYTANTASKIYWGTDPTFSGTVTGFVNGDNQAGATTGTLSWTSNAITASGTGTYRINGSGLTATNYTLVQAQANSTAYTINQATATYVADVASKTYGDANPTFSGTVTGLLNGETLANVTLGTLTWTSTATTGSASGSYDITGSGLTARNYTFVQAAGNNTALTVNKATLTYTANAALKTYGDANPAFSGTVTGFVNGDNLAGATSGTAAWASTATTGSAVGTYPVTGSGLSATNYTFAQATTNNSALTIGKATLTYTANAASKNYGDINPTFSGTVTGFVNNDNLAGATTGTTVWASTATTSSVVGSYPITGSGLSATNYSFTQAAANTTALTIGKASQTITFNTLTNRTYGDADFDPAATSDNTGTAVTYISSNTAVATIVSGKVHIVSAGNTNITASQAGDANHTAATDVIHALTVNTKPITVSLVATPTITKIYSGDNSATLSANNYQLNNLVAGDAAGVSVSGTATYDDPNVGATKTVTATSFVLTGSKKDNYNLTTTSATVSGSISAYPLTITAGAKNKTYGDTDPALTYTASASLKGTDSYTGALTRDAGENTGNYAIKIGTLSPGSNYSVSYTGANLVIGKKTITVTAAPKSKTYGDSDPAFTYANDPLVGSDAFTGALSRDAGENKGTYSIKQGTLALSSNYTLNYTGADLTIGAKTITVTAAPKSKTYGDSDPALTYANDPLVGSDTFTGALSRNAGENKGTYSIKQGTLALSSNYTLSYTGADLTIGAKAIAVTAAPKSKTYGDTDPSLTYTNTALVGSDAFTGALTRDAGENKGTYSIKQGTLALSSNYTLNYAGSDLTIGAKTITVTAAPKSKTYGDSDPALTYTNTALVGSDAFTGALTRDAGENKGTYGIKQGTLALSSNYTLAYTGADLTIGAKAITVTAAPKSKTYGDSDPALTYTNTALVGSDAFTGSLTRDAGENVGSYAIKQGTLALSSNYTLSYTGANLVIGTKAITITAAAKNKIYGDVDPALTYTNTPLVGNDAFTGSLSRNAGENVGTYSIKQGTLALSSNYALSYTGADLTIGKKTIAVTATAQSKTYGDSDPALTYANDALVGSDAFTGALTRDAGENVGIYAIKQGTLALSGNYTLTYTGDNLSIGARAIGITADVKTKTYGDSDPALTYVVSRGNLVNGDKFTGTLTRDAGENVGSYAIKQGTLALSSNYTLSYAATGASLAITQKALTITADNKTKVYGAANPTLNAIYSGFITGEDATKLSTQPTLATTATAASAVGNYAITTSGAASDNYSITYVPGTLTVTKAALSIAADNKSKVYGTAIPALTATYSGFVNGDTNASLSTQPTLATTATATSAVGSYPITASAAASNNYTISYTPGVLTVSNATLTITADNKTKTYGAANPALTVTYSGFVNGDTQASLTTPATATTTATAASGAGTYTITPAGAAIPGYTIVYTNGSLTVNKAVLNIAADNKSRNYGVANPALTVTYSGFVNGDTNASLGTQPTIATNATTTSAPGTYAIIASGAASPNYTFTYASGTFTVIPLTNAIMANLTISSGALSPVFSGSTYSYETSVIYAVDQVTLTPTFDPTATITVNGVASGNGTASAPIALQSGDNIITLVVTAQDGITKLTYTVKVHRPLPPAAIVPTNVLSPNADGKNDSWVIKDIQLYPNNTVTIYDRAGREVYSKKGYNNDWDGTLKGAPLAQGTYYYIIDLGPNYEKLKGFITILKVQ